VNETASPRARNALPNHKRVESAVDLERSILDQFTEDLRAVLRTEAGQNVLATLVYGPRFGFLEGGIFKASADIYRLEGRRELARDIQAAACEADFELFFRAKAAHDGRALALLRARGRAVQRTATED
jgi:hypothetical protein